MKKTKLSFEEAKIELEQIIYNLQNDRYSIEDLTNELDKAKELLIYCESSLRLLQDKIIEINTEN